MNNKNTNKKVTTLFQDFTLGPAGIKKTAAGYSAWSFLMINRLITIFLFTVFCCATPALSAVAPATGLVEFMPQSWIITDDFTGVDLEVSIDGFLFSSHELSQREFMEVMGFNPSVHIGDEFPVENVSWWEAIRFCNLKSQRDGLPSCYDLASGECDLGAGGWRLPTEAEWMTAFGRDILYQGEDMTGRANLGSLK